MNKDKHIVAIGLDGFPYGSAPAQKLKMMGLALKRNGNRFTVIGHRFVRKNEQNTGLKKVGKMQGVKYLTTSPEVFSPKNIWKKLICLFKGRINEIQLLIRLKKSKKLDGLIIYNSNFFYSFTNALLARLLKVPVYLVYFELRFTLGSRMEVFSNINNFLFDRYIFTFFNGILTISKMLENQVRKYSPNTPLLIVPPIVDFHEYENIEGVKNYPYFLYCGSVAYIQVISFILECYKLLNTSVYKVVLIVSGDSNRILLLEQIISDMNLESDVEIYNNISDRELKELYVNANALLIPLRNTKQDKARFPHKIAEYCASKRPIITTKVGEITNFFDDESALIANEYDANLFADKMKFVIDNPARCEQIADNSYRIGMKYFDYSKYSKPITEFMFGDVR